MQLQAFGPRPGAAGEAVACLARAVITGAVSGTGIRHNTEYSVSAGKYEANDAKRCGRKPMMQYMQSNDSIPDENMAAVGTASHSVLLTPQSPSGICW